MNFANTTRLFIEALKFLLIFFRRYLMTTGVSSAAASAAALRITPLNINDMRPDLIGV